MREALERGRRRLRVCSDQATQRCRLAQDSVVVPSLCPLASPSPCRPVVSAPAPYRQHILTSSSLQQRQRVECSLLGGRQQADDLVAQLDGSSTASRASAGRDHGPRERHHCLHGKSWVHPLKPSKLARPRLASPRLARRKSCVGKCLGCRRLLFRVELAVPGLKKQKSKQNKTILTIAIQTQLFVHGSGKLHATTACCRQPSLLERPQG